MHHYGDNFIPVLAQTPLLHTEETLFCGDPTCICYKDEQNQALLAQAIEDGLITLEDATQIMKGKTV